MYKLFTSITNQKFVICLSDNTYIPFAPDNTDYQTYLKWVAEGGVPTPADE
jgi:hypothetical protein